MLIILSCVSKTLSIHAGTNAKIQNNCLVIQILDLVGNRNHDQFSEINSVASAPIESSNLLSLTFCGEQYKKWHHFFEFIRKLHGNWHKIGHIAKDAPTHSHVVQHDSELSQC